MAGLGSYSYGDTTIKQSLWDDLKDLYAAETYVSSSSAKVSVSQKVHSWNVDPISSVTGGSGTLELADTTYTGNDPELITNNTQIIEYGFAVASSSENSDHAGIKSKFAREQMKAMKKWKNNLEVSAVAGTLVSGTGTAARTMQGFARFATLTTGHSGVSLTSDILDSLLGNAWDFGGGEHDTILVGRTLKGRISSFTAGNTKNVDASEATIYGRVDVYESDMGRVKIILHRFVNNLSANTYNSLVSYMQDFVQIGFLDEPHFEDRAKTGYYKPGAVVGEATVQLSNRLAAQLARGLL